MVIRLRRGAVCAAIVVLLLAGAAPPGARRRLLDLRAGRPRDGLRGGLHGGGQRPLRDLPQRRRDRLPEGEEPLPRRTLVSPSFDFTGEDPFPGAGVVESSVSNILPVPALYYTHQFSEAVVFGVGVHTPFGLRTEWERPDQFTGRFLSQRADLKSLSVNPTVGFRLADRLSLGVGFDIRLAKVELLRKRAHREPLHPEGHGHRDRRTSRATGTAASASTSASSASPPTAGRWASPIATR